MRFHTDREQPRRFEHRVFERNVVDKIIVVKVFVRLVALIVRRIIFVVFFFTEFSLHFVCLFQRAVAADFQYEFARV